MGKTTAAVNLAAGLAAPRRRVLLLDLDSQASASLWCGIDRARLRPSSANCPARRAAAAAGGADDVGAASRPRHWFGRARQRDLALSDVAGRELTLKHLDQRLSTHYDVVVLDCPPNLSLVGVNAIVAADALIVPVTPQHLAVEGLVSLLASLEKVRVRLGTRTRLLGILLTMVDPSTGRSVRVARTPAGAVPRSTSSTPRFWPAAPSKRRRRWRRPSSTSRRAHGRPMPSAASRVKCSSGSARSSIKDIPNCELSLPGFRQLGVERSARPALADSVSLK